MIYSVAATNRAGSVSARCLNPLANGTALSTPSSACSYSASSKVQEDFEVFPFINIFVPRRKAMQKALISAIPAMRGWMVRSYEYTTSKIYLD